MLCDGRDALGDPLSLETIPPRVFSELMRDVDLLVGVASIGNDPTWVDGGADAEHPSQWRRTAAQSRWPRARQARGGARRVDQADIHDGISLRHVRMTDECLSCDAHKNISDRKRLPSWGVSHQRQGECR